jgi:hypothetical protein
MRKNKGQKKNGWRLINPSNINRNKITLFVMAAIILASGIISMILITLTCSSLKGSAIPFLHDLTPKYVLEWKMENEDSKLC